MDYILSNKKAWEEAFDKRYEGWGNDILDRLQNEDFPYFKPEMIKVFKKYNFNDKTVAQFCSNNGRELLSLVKSSGAKEGFGFDIAENQTNYANQKANELGIRCKFIPVNILDIGDEYSSLDLIIITAGALCWFKDLDTFFNKVSKCLTKNGILLINEIHPVTNMLAALGEDDFDESSPSKLIHSYFNKEWVQNDGMYYITKKKYESKTFTSYTHPYSEIINAMCLSGIKIKAINEFNIDISDLFVHLNYKEIPLSFILEGQKE
jgi:ubiquinone/menaquinone biosynthesis C-methylase UbiE